ncbi:MAG: hypothetical protein RLZZ519_2633 [Bacteroidota bacterium]|jgi:hypothetical protein
MKKYIAIFALLLSAASAFAQNGINHVFVQQDINGDQVTYNVILAGPGANDVASMTITLSSGSDCRVCTNVTLPMSSSSGNQWTGGGQGFVALALGGPGKRRITIEMVNGDIDIYRFAFNTNGPGASSGHATVKAELE